MNDAAMARVSERWREVEEYAANPRHVVAARFNALLPMLKADPVLGRLSPFMCMDGLALSRCTEIPGYVDLVFGAWADNDYTVNITDGSGIWTHGLPIGDGDAQAAVRMAREFVTNEYPPAIVATADALRGKLDSDPVTLKLRAARPRAERCESPQHRGWLDLRHQLWPACPKQEHETDAAAICAGSDRLAAFVAHGHAGIPLGLVEVSTRSDYVNGTSTTPVGFIEGLYVIEGARWRGVARLLVSAAEQWARERGCLEMASDALIDNEDSHAVHRRLGFEVTERVVYFRKDLI